MAEAPNNNQAAAPNMGRSAIANMFSSMFSGKGTSGMPDAGKQVQQNQEAMPTNQNTTNPTQKTDDPTHTKQNDQQTAPSPLDAFKDLFTIDNSNNADASPPSLNLSPEQVNEVASKLDFTQNLPPEVMEGISQMGDQGKIFLQALNFVGRQAYSNALQHNSVLTDRFTGAVRDYDSSRLGSAVRKELLNNSLHSTTKADHPAVKALKGMVAEQLYAKNPDATPDWVQEQVNSFLLGVSQATGGNMTGAQDTNQEPKDVNWDDFLNSK